MIFGADLVGKVLDGSKTVTRRRLTHRDGRDIHYQVGHVYAVQPGRGKPHVGHIRVTGVSIQPLSMVGNGDFRAEGFNNVADFALYWEHLHGGTGSWDEPVAVIRFELADRCPNCLWWEPTP